MTDFDAIRDLEIDLGVKIAPKLAPVTAKCGHEVEVVAPGTECEDVPDCCEACSYEFAPEATEAEITQAFVEMGETSERAAKMAADVMGSRGKNQ